VRIQRTSRICLSLHAGRYSRPPSSWCSLTSLDARIHPSIHLILSFGPIPIRAEMGWSIIMIIVIIVIMTTACIPLLARSNNHLVLCCIACTCTSFPILPYLSYHTLCAVCTGRIRKCLKSHLPYPLAVLQTVRIITPSTTAVCRQPRPSRALSPACLSTTRDTT
jgi:hypothetical protein